MKKAERGNKVKNLDVGKMIRQVMFNTSMNKARISRQLGRHAAGVKKLLNNSSIQAYIIWEFGLALNHNFFADLAQQFDEATGAGNPSPQARIAQLEKEKSDLELQVKTLKEVIEVMGRK